MIAKTLDESIARTESSVQQNWQDSIKSAIRSPEALLEALGIAPHQLPFSQAGNSQFPLFVTREFVARMEPGNPSDPLLKQVWPFDAEGLYDPMGTDDPVGDLDVETAPGLLHKYRGRVLMIASGACAIHCRYCFRRHFPYENSPKHPAAWEEAFNVIQADPTIHEVILSGGDPLSLVDSRIGTLVSRIETISHVKRLRIHTRLPVVIPSRVTSELVGILKESRLATWFVLHINHPNEIDEPLLGAIERLRQAGVSMLNQTVLLKSINDDVETLSHLFEELVDNHVQPYYLHQLDRVQGAGHWEVPVEQGLQLIEALRARLPGYAVPLYVKENSGTPNKSPLVSIAHH